MTQARGESVFLTENHETMIRKASEHAAFARTVENGLYVTTGCVPHVVGGTSVLNSGISDRMWTECGLRQCVSVQWQFL